MTLKIAIYTDYDNVVQNDLLFSHDTENNEYIFLRNELVDQGHEIHTLDVFFKNKLPIDVCLFLDMPKKNVSNIVGNRVREKTKKRENKNIIAENYNLSRH